MQPLQGKVAVITGAGCEAVQANRCYVFAHPPIMPSVRERFEAALGGNPPADPLASRTGDEHRRA